MHADRGKEAARLHVLPTLWFRSTWSWGDEGEKPRTARGTRVGMDGKSRALDQVFIERLWRTLKYKHLSQ